MLTFVLIGMVLGAALSGWLGSPATLAVSGALAALAFAYHVGQAVAALREEDRGGG